MKKLTLIITILMAGFLTVTASASNFIVVNEFPSPSIIPFGLAWDGNYLWHADRASKLIYKLSPANGSIITSFTPPAPISDPAGLTWGGSYLWCADWSGGMIYKLNVSTKTIVNSFRSPEGSPFGLAWDGKYLWCAEVFAGRLYKLNPSDGSVILSFEFPFWLSGLTFDGTSFWITGQEPVVNGDCQIYLVSSSGEILSVYQPPGKIPRGLTWDGEYLWNSDNYTHTIYQINKYVCYPDLPAPKLCVTGVEEEETLTRYNLSVTNWSVFPDKLFEAAPDLPPCGLNENASRTRVDIFANDDTYLYGFCAFSSSENLLDLWFTVPIGESPPDSVYITLEDRGCDITYTSNLASTKYFCYPDLPAPKLCVTGVEEKETTTRYNLSVLNWEAFPDELFEEAPDLPPCGLNENASRTWVDIFADDGTRLYGFCGLSSSESLLDLWFAVSIGESPPDFVYITLEDRGSNITYTSNLASTSLNYQIHSVWASTPPVIDGVVSPDEWMIPPGTGGTSMNAVGEIQLCYGQMLVQNDHEYLYILVDVTEDTHDDQPLSSEPWGDFFQLAFDVDSNKMIVPGEDVQYGLYPGTHELGLQYYQGPGTWTSLRATESSLGAGFGQGMNAFTAHRFWEFAISLEEIKTGLEDWLNDPGMMKPIRTGLRTYSQTPMFDFYYPSSFPTDFSKLIEIFPAFGPSVPSGDYIFRGVGAIPAKEIDEDGYATTVPGYHPYVVDAPFGSFLRIFGNFNYLRANGAKYYKVLYSRIDVSTLPASQPLKQSWVNYRWEQVDPMTYKWVPHTITYKDAAGQEDVYEIPSMTEDWYFNNLLVGWSSWRFPDDKYSLRLEAFTETGMPVIFPAPLSGAAANPNELILMLDNTRPHVEIVEIAHGEEVVSRCDIVYLDENNLQDGLRFTITVHDDKIGDNYINKHLYGYKLVAHYGSNESVPIGGDNYSNHPDENGLNLWGGVQNLVIPAETESPWRPPESCAYQFRLSARSRTTNGYSRRIHYNEYNEHVTILLGEPGTPCNPGDASGDGNITAYDAALILQFVVGLISELPPVSSAQSPTGIPQHNYSVTIPELTARAGDRIQVPVAVNDREGLTYGGIVVKFDQNVLKAERVVSPLSGSYWRANTERQGEVRFAFAIAEPTKGEGDLLMLEFSVLPNTDGKVSPLILENIQFPENLGITSKNGYVAVLPEKSMLLQNYPNPFNPETWLPYQLAQDAPVTISVYNAKGQFVRLINLGTQRAGVYLTKESAAYWNGRNNLGEEVAGGVYFYTLRAGEFTASRRMLIVK